MSVFQFVYIPMDTNRPLEQWTQEIEKGREVECLLDRIKTHFVQTHPSVSETQKKRHRQELLKKVKDPSTVSLELLNAATDTQLVESIALLPCMAKYGNVGVTMYVDDAGSFKQVSHNLRATDIAHQCGLSSSAILGDAFIAKVRETDEEFERMDFSLSEVSSDASWMKEARSHNQQKTYQRPAEDILKELQKKPKIEAPSPEEEERQKGNEAFKEGDYAKAIEAYSRCIELNTKSVLAYSNRAMAFLRVGKYEEALGDAESAIRMDGKCTKALYRKGLALEGLGRKEEAIETFKHLSKLQPSKAIQQKLDELVKLTL